MMTNLFSSFDPGTSFSLSLYWLSIFLGMIFIPPAFWLIPSRYSFLWNKIIITLHNEFKMLIGSKIKGSTLIFISLFSFILFNNLLGLFPYIFTGTSHLIMTLVLALPLWLSFMIYGWTNNTTHMFAHLVPQGTPPVLMPFMVIIETISNIIRPGTLAVRLSANMIAGHLLMTLMGNTDPSATMIILSILLIIQILLFSFVLSTKIIFLAMRTLVSP